MTTHDDSQPLGGPSFQWLEFPGYPGSGKIGGFKPIPVGFMCKYIFFRLTYIIYIYISLAINEICPFILHVHLFCMSMYDCKISVCL